MRGGHLEKRCFVRAGHGVVKAIGNSVSTNTSERCHCEGGLDSIEWTETASEVGTHAVIE